MNTCMKPTLLIRSAHVNTSRTSLHLNDIFLAVTQSSGRYECKANLVYERIDCLKYAAFRDKVLDRMLRYEVKPSLHRYEVIQGVAHFQGGFGDPIKMYQYVRYSNGVFTWAYTDEYRQFFDEAGIPLPHNEEV